MNDASTGLMIEMRDFDLTAPGLPPDPNDLRWYALECQVSIRLGDAPPVLLPNVPGVQFVLSFDHAVQTCERVGRAEWEIFDAGRGYRLIQRDGQIVFGDGVGEARDSLGAVRDLVLALRKSLLDQVAAWSHEAVDAVRQASTPAFP